MSRIDPKLQEYIQDLMQRYVQLKSAEEDLIQSFLLLKETFQEGNKLLICGNGGSAADSEHIVGELMKGFILPRSIGNEMEQKLCTVAPKEGKVLADKLQMALPAIALTGHNALSTAFLNDVDGKICYAQQVLGYGKPGDAFWGISTSGNSANVVYAAVTAKAKGMKVIGLTGKLGGKLADLADVCMKVDETETYKIQELHLPVYHCLCMMLEQAFFAMP